MKNKIFLFLCGLISMSQLFAQPTEPCTTPASQASHLVLYATANTIAGNFTPSANTDSYLIVSSNAPALTALPAENIHYVAGDAIGNAQVLFNTSNTSFVIPNLAPATTYYLYIFAANKNCSGGEKYFTTAPLTGNSTTNLSGTNNIYFGNLHSHSDYSDGNKDNPGYTPADDYLYAMTAQCMDYLGIAEHNHYSSNNNPGTLVSNYHLGSQQANTFNLSHPNFLALYGMEWGVISGGGHVVVYGDGMDQLFGWETNAGGVPGNNYDVYVAKNDYTGANGLFKTINDRINKNTFATLAHPNFTDFGNIAGSYNAVADNAIVGTAVASGPAFSTNTTYSNPPSSMYYLPYYQKLLAMGYHVGPTIDHDNHYTTFGKTSYTRTAIIAPALTKTEIVKAMRDMHFYATEDCDSKVDFSINTQIMGSQIMERYAPVINVKLSDATTPTSNAIINVMFGVPGSTLNATNIYSSIGNTLTYTDTQLPDGATGYYYLDISNGSSRIITAPIWYSRNDALVLPVNLTAFDVQKINSNVKITWSTAQETNSSQFEVQHSVDARNWTTIATVHAAGNSNVPLFYNSMDYAPVMGINYYRLKQTDNSANAQYSNVKTIIFNPGYEVLITPNPAHANLNIYLAKTNNPATQILLYKVSGQLVNHWVTHELHLQINVSTLPRGMYFIKLINGEDVKIEKLLIQ